MYDLACLTKHTGLSVLLESLGKSKKTTKNASGS